MPSNEYEGRLDLTWTNKHLRLLAGQEGGYEWLSPSDYRVAEVRLLHDAGTVGTTRALSARAKDNLLIRGDALHALTSIISIPEFAREYVDKVKLVYIDPPFNTGEAFEQYDDNLEHSVWLTMMRDRLVQIQKLLAPDGSVWVHLNDDEAAYAKVILDDLFTRENFIATFIWQKVDSPSENKKPVSVDHDYIFCYSKKPGATHFPQKPDPSVGEAFGGLDAATNRRYRDRLLKKNGKESLRKDRTSMWFAIPGPDGAGVFPIHDDGREARWSAGDEKVSSWLTDDANMTSPDDRNIIWKERPGRFVRIRPDLAEGEEDDSKPRWRLDAEGAHWVPYTREWAPDKPTRPWPTIWSASPFSAAQELAAEAMRSEEFGELDPEGAIASALTEVAAIKVLDDVKTTRQAKAHLRKLFPGVTPFETPKPEELMARIVEIATNEGDIVLDCFAGSGSTLTTAHKLGRRWVGVEWERSTLETFTASRLQKVVDGTDEWGISSHVGWEGGGGFRVLDVAPSMFAADGQVVFLAGWAANTKLAEATAAQLGYEYRPESPFCGSKGRSRLAVIDGLVNADVIRLLLSALPDSERLVVCGTAVDSAARDVLREMRPGSALRKIPSSILDEYREQLRWTVEPRPQLASIPAEPSAEVASSAR